MKPFSKTSSSLLFCTAHRALPSLSRPKCQGLHVSSQNNAIPLPITATGPPPAAPVSPNSEHIVRRLRQAELLRHGKALRADENKSGDKLKKRFWKDVSVKTDSVGTHTIHLDTRPVRNPSTKRPLPIPRSKPHLATAIALEWDLLTSAKDILQPHLIPLTSLASRANDMMLEEFHTSRYSTKTRKEIVESLLNYLNTDTLLCWAPAPSRLSSNDAYDENEKTPTPPSLRDLQMCVAKPIIEFLTTYVWPAVELVPALNPHSILPVDQPADSQAIIRGWMYNLSPWDLAGLERATLAGKSLLVGVRLLVEWGETFRNLRMGGIGTKFGIEEAAEACSLELRWQTGKWGEVEDSHDVEREDLRRQFGSVVLLVGGTGT